MSEDKNSLKFLFSLNYSLKVFDISEYRISSNKRTMWIVKDVAHTWLLALIKRNAVLAIITANIAHK